jgi:hypothetical protein|tara:strand:+ start:255 stop:434 length:180 start_codon:yes stop_codon:yes gene_type:complete
MKARIDKILNRYVSRKLMVFVVASFGLFSATLTSSDWVTIAAVYIGTQGAIDAIAKLRQ